MTSFVEYHGFGFWCRNAILADWLRELGIVAGPRATEWTWLTRANFYWAAVRSGLKSQRMTLYLDSDVDTPDKQWQCEELFTAAAARSLRPPTSRCAVLAVALIRGDLTGTRSRSVDFWAGEEWNQA